MDAGTRRALASNRYAYQQFAHWMLDGRAHKAFGARAEMLTLREQDHRRARAESLPNDYLEALERTVQTWRDAGYSLEETALELGMRYRTLARRRAEAKRRGLSPLD
jgi:hypothetical protein